MISKVTLATINDFIFNLVVTYRVSMGLPLYRRRTYDSFLLKRRGNNCLIFYRIRNLERKEWIICQKVYNEIVVTWIKSFHFSLLFLPLFYILAVVWLNAWELLSLKSLCGVTFEFQAFFCLSLFNEKNQCFQAVYWIEVYSIDTLYSVP